jgi:hypothetical protein
MGGEQPLTSSFKDSQILVSVEPPRVELYRLL